MLANITAKKVSNGGVNSEWNDAVDRAMKAIDNRDMRTKEPWTFKRWCGYLRNVPAYKIHEMVALAVKASNTGAHFNWQVKEYKKRSAKATD